MNGRTGRFVFLDLPETQPSCDCVHVRDIVYRGDNRKLELKILSIDYSIQFIHSFIHQIVTRSRVCSCTLINRVTLDHHPQLLLIYYSETSR